jgi:hypothetical protein
LVTSLFADLKTSMDHRETRRRRTNYRCCRKMEGSSRVVDHPLTPIAEVQQRHNHSVDEQQWLQWMQVKGDAHSSWRKLRQDTAENVVKVTCRRMQKDQFDQQVNNVE